MALPCYRILHSTYKNRLHELVLTRCPTWRRKAEAARNHPDCTRYARSPFQKITPLLGGQRLRGRPSARTCLGLRVRGRSEGGDGAFSFTCSFSLHVCIRAAKNQNSVSKRHPASTRQREAEERRRQARRRAAEDSDRPALPGKGSESRVGPPRTPAPFPSPQN